MDGGDRGKVFRKLRALGFTSAQSKGATRSFEGTLHCRHGDIPVRLDIIDWTFQTYPTIRLLSRPSFVPSVLPHVDASGELCYFSPGSVVLDRYKPDDALWQCIHQAQIELDRLISDEAYRKQEFHKEFEANWAVGQSPEPSPLLLGEVSVTDGPIDCFQIGTDTEHWMIVSGDRDAVEKLCATRRWPRCDPLGEKCWILKSSNCPSLPTSGLPSTVQEVLAWIKSWDPQVRKTIHDIWGKADYLKHKSMIFLIQTPCGWCGFEVELDLARRKGCLRRPTTYRQYLYGSGGTRSIARTRVFNVSAEYIHHRNLLKTGLQGKRISLVGCGAIGGHLALALAKLGAGLGSHGVLRLIDPDILQSENLGRHLLGLESIFEPKSEALRRHLLGQFPLLNIDAQQRRFDASDCACDLIIDATGEEALGEEINYQRLSLPPRSRPQALHVWILGNGECTQAIWCDTKKHACLHCLRQEDAARTKRFDPIVTAPEVRVRGCEAFTPYAISAPLTGASLAIDMVTAWLANSLKLRFRTRVVEGANVRPIKSQDVEPLSGCAACGIQS
ncbi:ThiF family adenylyltransferase [Dyella flagellata]|uniref:THIF-type NAD/FAD binding fold domain-containing protein n=1 Tax=Dyella flagellata TaxID=1867833 RepID=A0ABQ5X948_9GAMM|nr:ThiF family adenylyltransferase [Dyella flagellata]GLQ87706.1 hypothetical protein GCM10007898_12730 [Dyella flagellata]